VRQIDESVHGSGLPLSRRRAVREGTEISNAAISRVGGEGGGRAKGQGTNNRKTALLVVGRSQAAAGGAGDAKVPFEDSYFPGSHGCHTRPPAILRLSLHCGNHNYTCGCLLIAARSPDPSRPTAAAPSFEDPLPVRLSVVPTSTEARNLDPGRKRIRSPQRFDLEDATYNRRNSEYVIITAMALFFLRVAYDYAMLLYARVLLCTYIARL